MNQSVVGERYRIEARIGSGGMAEVYRGVDPVLNRTVAIKVLLPQFARDAGFVARFRREAQAAARLNHPSIVGVFDTGADGDTQYIVMEFVEGRTLHDFLAGGKRMGVMPAVEMTQKIAEAVTAAHEQGVIHRDIKPANVMVTREGAMKVMDFGIARIETAETAPQTSAVLGTASYLSPEQAQGMPVDARSDIYSLGTVLYELLCGRPPFTGDSPVAIAYKQVNEAPIPPSELNPDVPPRLDAVVMKALAKNPANRYQTARSFWDDLERVRKGQEVEATPLLPTGTGADATQVIARPQATAVLPPQEEEPGSGRKVWLGVLIGILVVALLAGGGWLLAQSLMGDDVEQITVENVRGLPFDEAKRVLEGQGLVVLEPPNTREVDPADAEPGSVVAQRPRPGEIVDEGTEVTLTIAVEPELVEVPSLVGLTIDQARSLLGPLGLDIGNRTTEPSTTVPVDAIVSHSPPEGEEVEPGTPVDVVLSSGPADLQVPDVTCVPFGAARTQLVRAGFSNVSLANERRELPAACPFNEANIAFQEPSAGSVVAPDTPIVLYQGVRASPTPSPTPPPEDG
jgi:eukaryotic-like serine/threonine-protein kinase